MIAERSWVANVFLCKVRIPTDKNPMCVCQNICYDSVWGELITATVLQSWDFQHPGRQSYNHSITMSLYFVDCLIASTLCRIYNHQLSELSRKTSHNLAPAKTTALFVCFCLNEWESRVSATVLPVCSCQADTVNLATLLQDHQTVWFVSCTKMGSCSCLQSCITKTPHLKEVDLVWGSMEQHLACLK